MPNRYVREAAIRSKAVNSLSWHGEVFYRRLINLVDDFGRYHADEELLRTEVFPRQLDRVRLADIERLIAECEKAVLLFRYEVDGKLFMVLNQWERGRATTSLYPQPPDNILQRMQTDTYTCKHKHVYAPDSDTDSDTDPDSDSAPSWMMVEDFKSAWSAWKKHRKEIRHKLTKSTASKQLEMLAKLGREAAIDSINTSIEKGWQGLFEPKAAGFSKPQQTSLGYIPDAISK